jgi:hypothetical protein
VSVRWGSHYAKESLPGNVGKLSFKHHPMTRHVDDDHAFGPTEPAQIFHRDLLCEPRMIRSFSVRNVKTLLGSSCRSTSALGWSQASTSRPVFASCSTPRFSSSRHSLSSGTRRGPLNPQLMVRYASRGPRQSRIDLSDLSGIQEEATRAAILEKVMKGRQPADLMLRCKLFKSSSLIFTEP